MHAQKKHTRLTGILWIAAGLATMVAIAIPLYGNCTTSYTDGNISCAMACSQLTATEFYCSEPEIAGVVLWTKCMCVTDASPSEEIGPIGELVTLTGRVYDVVCAAAQKERLHRRRSWYDW